MLALRKRWGKSHTYTGKCIFFLFLLSLVLCAPLYTQGFFDGHDYWAHAMRITSTMNGLSDGQIPPQIGTEANAYGYSWNLFYGPLSNYLVVFFRMLTIWIPGATMALAYKLFIFSTFFFSGFFLFRFVREVVKNENTALLAACLYLLAPYRAACPPTSFCIPPAKAKYSAAPLASNRGNTKNALIPMAKPALTARCSSVCF
mgnify:CR=1 FL=1